ncbi:MAG: AzlD domain-containing protein [Roseobacter sp.]
MEPNAILLIGGLAIATFAVRALGLITGNFFQESRFSWALRNLPGILIVSLVASSLANMTLVGWAAASIALGIALYSNHVILTMIGGVAAYALLQNIM